MEKLTLCPDCDHVLYPREDKVERRLLYVCNQCSYQIPVERNIFFLSKYPISITNESAMMKKKNPVLPHSKGVVCVKCKHKEAAFFQAVVRDEECEEPRLALFLVCASISCGHQWRADS